MNAKVVLVCLALLCLTSSIEAGASLNGRVMCSMDCDADYGDCDVNVENGCESFLSTDVYNCGSCNNSCETGEYIPGCQNGVCVVVECPSGVGDCNSDATDGCEVDHESDSMNCGECGNDCVKQGVLTAHCDKGGCVIDQCKTDSLDCDESSANGCEINIFTDVDNCGACNKKCEIPNGTPSCFNGVCKVQSCNSGWMDCDKDPSNGCETRVETSVDNCGYCGRSCHVSNTDDVTCVNGACVIDTCQAGWGNCDRNVTNGCERPIAIDPNNCNSCGHVCPNVQRAQKTCMQGECGFTCTAPYGDCNNNVNDGCEVNLKTDRKNCGKCGRACNNYYTCTNGACVLAVGKK